MVAIIAYNCGIYITWLLAEAWRYFTVLVQARRFQVDWYSVGYIAGSLEAVDVRL